jgi:hypothetical protein
MESTQLRIIFKGREADHWPSSGVEIQIECSPGPLYFVTVCTETRFVYSAFGVVDHTIWNAEWLRREELI